MLVQVSRDTRSDSSSGKHLVPQPRRLTDEQESAALGEYRAALGTYGAIAILARRYGVSWQGMKGILRRAAVRETNLEVSRETSISEVAE